MLSGMHRATFCSRPDDGHSGMNETTKPAPDRPATGGPKAGKMSTVKQGCGGHSWLCGNVGQERKQGMGY